MARLGPISVSEYAEFLRRLWPGVAFPSRLGIALSGGVDSMALAYLTSRLALSLGEAPRSISAFIVDHKARPESTYEAYSVAQIAETTYNFTPHVLPLEWTLSPSDLRKGFETRARIARYQVLAKACAENRVERLLLAHHADDQAETVIMRLLAGSRMEGLAGMRAVSRIPECGDVFGADRVVVGRPLLGTEKERLRTTCLENGVLWFEDKTNQDATLTRRNCVRKLLGASPPRFPRALQRPALVELAQRAQVRNKSIRDQARKVLKENCKISFDGATGSLEIQLPENIDNIHPWVLRKLLVEVAEMISPLPRVEARSMQTAFGIIFGTKDTHFRPKFTTAGLKWTNLAGQKWLLQRQQYTSRSGSLPTLTFTTPGWTTWHLWDGRWWVKVFIPAQRLITVRPLGKKDMKPLREKAAQAQKSKDLDRVLGDLKGELRFIVPAIFDGEEIVALPSVGLRLDGNGDVASGEGLRWEVMLRGNR